MSHRWMFDVLVDLESYASRNGLPQLARRLSEVAGQAAHELALIPSGRPGERAEAPTSARHRAD
ncbi:hypothetical protein [Limimaricola cinnabarinus]|uniref:hypothetical protein n=1 Tax=Limimaricola cinnabarinus TaxID=1125964 RepID=UPI0039E65A40